MCLWRGGTGGRRIFIHSSRVFLFVGREVPREIGFSLSEGRKIARSAQKIFGIQTSQKQTKILDFCAIWCFLRSLSLLPFIPPFGVCGARVRGRTQMLVRAPLPLSNKSRFEIINFENYVFSKSCISTDTSEQRALSGYSACTEQGRKQAHQFQNEIWDI